MSSTDSALPLGELDVVVDTDAHLSERAEQLVPYLDEPYVSLFGAGEEGANVATPTYPKDGLFRSLGGKFKWSDVNTAGPSASRWLSSASTMC